MLLLYPWGGGYNSLCKHSLESYYSIVFVLNRTWKQKKLKSISYRWYLWVAEIHRTIILKVPLSNQHQVHLHWIHQQFKVHLKKLKNSRILNYLQHYLQQWESMSLACQDQRIRRRIILIEDDYAQDSYLYVSEEMAMGFRMRLLIFC